MAFYWMPTERLEQVRKEKRLPSWCRCGGVEGVSTRERKEVHQDASPLDGGKPYVTGRRGANLATPRSQIKTRCGLVKEIGQYSLHVGRGRKSPAPRPWSLLPLGEGKDHWRTRDAVIQTVCLRLSQDQGNNEPASLYHRTSNHSVTGSSSLLLGDDKSLERKLLWSTGA